MNEMKITPLENSKIYKSNIFISAKYKSTLIENKITGIALSRIQMKHLKDSSDYEVSAELYPGELKRLLKADTNLYKILKTTSKRMTNKTMLIEDGKGNFKTFAMITNADYVNGVFKITFNKELRPLISNLKGPYTELEERVFLSLNSNHAYRLYELLKKEMYRTNRKMIDGHIEVEYNISELKFMIGICDIDNKNIQSLRAQMGNNIDYDKLFDKLPKSEQTYSHSSSDFIRRVIIPAQKELLEKSNIKFDYEPIKTKGKKVGSIKFYIYMENINAASLGLKAAFIDDEIDIPEILCDEQTIDVYDDSQEFRNNSDDDNIICINDEVYDLYDEFIGFHNLTKEDIDILMKYANGNIQRIKDAIYYVSEKSHVESSFMGYVVAILKNPDWNLEGTVVVHGHDLNKEMVKATKNIEREKKKAETKKKNPQDIWEHVIKKRPDFCDFLLDLEKVKKWSLDDFEAVYDYPEMIDIWKKWERENQ